jgi:hypothetical protein
VKDEISKMIETAELPCEQDNVVAVLLISDARMRAVSD